PILFVSFVPFRGKNIPLNLGAPVSSPPCRISRFSRWLRPHRATPRRLCAPRNSPILLLRSTPGPLASAPLFRKFYVPTSQSQRFQHHRGEAQRPEALRARGSSQAPRPVEGRRPRPRSPQDQARRLKS